MRLARLLFPLISAGLLEGEAAPPSSDSTELTSVTFAPTIAKGLWFVKFFSPTCPHCTQLAPHWKKVEDKYNSKDTGIKIASVDCIAQHDVCASQHVAGYPTMNLYHDGVLIANKANTITDDPFKMLDDFIKERLLAEERAASDESTPAQDKGPSASAEAKKAPEPATPNPEGKSVVLTMDNFRDLVSDTKQIWFIKFYTTWCSHCKAMAPSWQELATTTKGKLNIGEVDCDKQSRLCKDAGVRGYPTLLVFQGVQHVAYDGLRGLGDLVSFANKAAESQVKEIDATDFEALQKKNEVVFLYFYDFATTTEDFEALDRTALSLIGHAPLVKTSNDILASKFRVTTFPKLTVIKDGKPQYYNALAPADMRDTGKMLAWMRTNWLPLVPELSAQTSHEIMGGRHVVLAILDPDTSGFSLQKQVLRDAAQRVMDDKFAEEQAGKMQQREKKGAKLQEALKKGDEEKVEEAKRIRVQVQHSPQVGFAWVDGVFWSKWLKATYNIDLATDGPRLLITNEDKGSYWDVDAKGKPIPVDKDAILSAIPLVLNGKLRAKSSNGGLHAAYQAAKLASNHPVSAGLLIFGSLAAVVIIFTRRAVLRRNRQLMDGHSREGLLTGKLD